MAPREVGCQRRHRATRRHGEPVRRRRGHGAVRHPGRPPRRCAPRRRAALELHAVVDAYLATLEPAFARSLAMHTGIATGLVVARRSDARAGDFALTGDTVNMAARLRSAAASREIVASAATWQQVSDAFDAESTAPLDAERQGAGARRLAHPRRAQGSGERRDGAGRTRRGAARLPRPRRGLRAAPAQPRRDRSRRSRRRQVAPASPSSSHCARALGFSCHGAPVLDFGAETGRDAVRSLARSLLGVDGAADEATRRTAHRGCEPGTADGRRSSSSSCTTCSTSRRRPSCARSPRR